MERTFINAMWQNFAGAMDMFKEVIRICPEDYWQNDNKFFYLSYHTLIFLDYYLSQPVSSFSPLLTYTITCGDLPTGAIDDVIPDRHFTREEIILYVQLVRKKSRQVILESPEIKFTQRWIKDEEIHLHDLCPELVKNYSLTDILFYNLRHLQHHVGQLNFMLRQNTGLAADWVAVAD